MSNRVLKFEPDSEGLSHRQDLVSPPRHRLATMRRPPRRSAPGYRQLRAQTSSFSGVRVTLPTGTPLAEAALLKSRNRAARRVNGREETHGDRLLHDAFASPGVWIEG